MSDVITELSMRVSELEKQLANVCRIAQVKKVHEDTAKLDITFEGLEIQEVPFLTQRAGDDQVYWLPSEGELGVLFSPSGDIANAIFLPGIFYSNFTAGEKSLTKVKRTFRDGTTEEIDVDAHSWKLSSGDSERFVDQEKVEDTQGTSKITIGTDETEITRTAGKVKLVTGMNTAEITAIVANILGSQIFPSGVTTLQSPVGPVMFAPSPSPATAPVPPSESAPDPDGNATKTPPSTISGVAVQEGSRLSFTIPSLVVTGTSPSGPVTGTTTAILVNVSTTGTVTLQFPARPL